MVRTTIMQITQQLRDASLQLRMRQVRGNFCKRREHKFPLVHSRMRHFQLRLVDQFTSKKQQIEIDRARAPSLTPYSTEKSLDVEQSIQHIARCKRRSDLDDRVQKVRRAGRSSGRGILQQVG